MSPMPILSESNGLPVPGPDHDPLAPLPESQVQSPMADDRGADELEAHSIKWNVARIVRLSSGRFALLTHYHAGALDIIKVGTIEEIIDHIPTAAQCDDDIPRMGREEPKRVKKDVSDLLADLGL